MAEEVEFWAVTGKGITGVVDGSVRDREWALLSSLGVAATDPKQWMGGLTRCGRERADGDVCGGGWAAPGFVAVADPMKESTRGGDSRTCMRRGFAW